MRFKNGAPLIPFKFAYFQAIDEGTQNLLGEVEIPLSDVTNEPEMELYQVKKYLTHESYKKSTVVLTLRVRAFKPCEVSEDEPWAFNEADEKMSVKTGKKY